jgi:hypothetical protein
MLSLAAHASEVTFDWVPTVEDSSPPTTGIASGSLTIDLSSWTLMTPAPNPNLGAYFTSGTAIQGTITAFSFTSGNGLTADLADLSTTTVGNGNTEAPVVWATSSTDTPAAGAQSPAGTPTAGYYLISPFSVSGDTAGGTPFMVANGGPGTAGATFANGIPNADVNFNPDGSLPGLENGGYWEVAPVPLPAGLPMLLSGLALLGWIMRRGPTAADRSSPSLAT